MEKSASAYRSETLKGALAVFGKSVLSWIIILMVSMSLSVIFTAWGTEPNGYNIYDQDGRLVSHVEMIDASEAEGGAAEDSVTLEEGQTYVETRSDPSPALQFLQNLLQALTAMILLCTLPFNDLWNRGEKDRNQADFGHMKADPLRGLRIGLLASVPAFLSYLLLIAARFGLLSAHYMSVYRVIHIPVIFWIRWFVPTAFTAADLSVGQLLALLPGLLPVPLVCTLAYWVGFKRVPVIDKLVYRKKKK